MRLNSLASVATEVKYDSTQLDVGINGGLTSAPECVIENVDYKF